MRCRGTMQHHYILYDSTLPWTSADAQWCIPPIPFNRTQITALSVQMLILLLHTHIQAMRMDSTRHSIISWGYIVQFLASTTFQSTPPPALVIGSETRGAFARAIFKVNRRTSGQRCASLSLEVANRRCAVNQKIPWRLEGWQTIYPSLKGSDHHTVVIVVMIMWTHLLLPQKESVVKFEQI